jgi:glycosyltransferase involved in cell wall biosynthesis
VIEAMMSGLPIVALATTEMATVIRNGVSGHTDTDIDKLVGHMQALLADRAAARALGKAARRYALERFAIGRFVADWEDALAAVTH